MDKIKIGQYRINLALVHEVEEWRNGGITIRYTGDNTELDGDAAKLFLMAWDGDDGDEFDALYEAVNGVPARPESKPASDTLSEYDRGYRDASQAIQKALEG